VEVMTFAFAFAYIGGVAHLEYYFKIGGAALVTLIVLGSFAAVVTAFFMHELAHKAVAQRYGAIAEFRYNPVGLLAGLVTSLFGTMLAFPGTVIISGKANARQLGRISAAGPLINLAFAALFIGISLALGTAPGRFREPIPIIIGAIAFVNVLLAMFNLIPVPPIVVHRMVAGRFPVNVTVPASDGFLVLVADKTAWAVSVGALLLLGVGGHLLAVF
jgi:Zn-dependent protease